MDQRKDVQPPEKAQNADKSTGSEGTGLAGHNDAMRHNRQIAEPSYRNGDDRQLRMRPVESYQEPARRSPVLDERAVANVERLLREHPSLVHEIE
jgi:hypothetical protein